MKVFVVILNWNQPKLTLECLKSCFDLKGKNYYLSLVVVDNHSDDDSVNEFKRLQEQKWSLKIIENKVNLGFAAGNNIGINYALKQGADYVMILNNDTRVHPDLMTQLIAGAKKYPNFGAASPKIYFAKGFEFHQERYTTADLGKVIWYAGGIIDWANVYGSGRGVDKVDKGQYDKIGETDYATGTCLFLSGRALKKIGLFNEKYFMYYEDTELSIRIKNAGFKVLYIPRAVVWHKVAQSSGIGSNLNDYFTTRNRLLFGMHYCGLRTRFALYRESLKFIFSGRPWQKRGVLDFYLLKYGRGSWQ